MGSGPGRSPQEPLATGAHCGDGVGVQPPCTWMNLNAPSRLPPAGREGRPAPTVISGFLNMRGGRALSRTGVGAGSSRGSGPGGRSPASAASRSSRCSPNRWPQTLPVQTCPALTGTRRNVPEGEGCVHKTTHAAWTLQSSFSAEGTVPDPRSQNESPRHPLNKHGPGPPLALQPGSRCVLRARTRGVGVAVLQTHAASRWGLCLQTLPGAAVGAG